MYISSRTSSGHFYLGKFMTAATMQLRLPTDEDTGPPKECFLDQAWLARDIAAVFRPRWLLAGHITELTGPGAYLTYSLGADEVLICKDGQGSVRAYYNVCSHRGSRLCGHAKGQIGARIVCPYHGWSYSPTTGALLAAPHMHDDFDRSHWGLRPVHVDVWFGLIFVCLADERPAPMVDHIGAVDFGGYNLADAKLASAKTHEIGANWKIVVENNLECYHCPLNHPELMAVRDWKISSSIEAFAGALKSRAKGLEVIQSDIACSHTVNGQKVCAIPFPRGGDAESDPTAYLLLWEPGMAMILSRDHGWIFSPKPVGPTRTELRQYWFVSGRAVEGKDYEIDPLREFWDVTMQQDRVLCENVQRGMEMHAYAPGPLNRIHQGGQAGFYAWYLEQIRCRFPEKDVDQKAGDLHARK
jgi:phenylpropionate dioxygenase-like ring-hydroxylating dioxygenase large terminal subunit